MSRRPYLPHFLDITTTSASEIPVPRAAPVATTAIRSLCTAQAHRVTRHKVIHDRNAVLTIRRRVCLQSSIRYAQAIKSP